MRLFLLLFTSLLPLINTFAQTKVFVARKSTNEGISSAFIYTQNGSFNAITSDKGFFSAPDSILNDTLYIQHPAFHTELTVLNQLIVKKILLEEKMIDLDEVVISVSKSVVKRVDIPNQVHVINANSIERSNPSTPVDILQESGAAFVQKSQSGGGSPVLRGFEANKILLVYDGLRMNNAIYRSGHIQNSINVDQSSLAGTEVTFGPGSVMHGSDALGGVIHYSSKSPEPTGKDTTEYLSNYIFRRSSANNELMVGASFQIKMKKLAVLTNVGYSSFGDIQAGTKTLSSYPNFATLPYYYRNVNGKDSTINNLNQYYQRHTAYDQLNYLQKYIYRVDENTKHTFKLYYTTTSEVPRFDRMNDMRENQMKYAKWNYGPQKWLILQHRFHKDGIQSKFVNSINTSVAKQEVQESRITRKFNEQEQRTRTEFVEVYSINLDLIKNIKKNTLSYGFDYHLNNVTSTAVNENIQTQASSPTITRYPNNGSSYISGAFYAYYIMKLGEKWHTHIGSRYNNNYASLNFKRNEVFNYDYGAQHKSQALTGVLGINYQPNYDWRYKIVFSTGYRAPNIDDMGKVFDTNDGQGVVTPNTDLKPEYLYNTEATVEFNLIDNIRLETGAFYSLITDVITRRPYTFQDQEYIMYDGQWSRVEAMQNSDLGIVYGAHFGLKGALSRSVVIKGTYNLTYGEDKTNNTPLSHIPPSYGTFHIDYGINKIRHGFWTIYNAWKKIEDYGPGATDKPEEATVDGTPAWYTLNYRLSYIPSERLKIFLQVENIADQLYKPFASGIAGPGRNMRLTIRTQI